MSRVEDILKQLADVAANPKKAMDDYKAETGKGAIGIMPLYAPEELVHATGYLPMWTKTNCKSTYIFASICLLYYAANYGITM